MNGSQFSPIFETTVGKLESALAAAGPSPAQQSRAIRDVLIDALSDPPYATGHLVMRVSESIAATVRVVRSLGGTVRDAVRGAMHGVLHGTADEHVWTTEVIEQVSASLVGHAIVSREDVLDVTRAIIEAARAAAEDLALSYDEAGLAAARGVHRGVREAHPDLCERVDAELRRQVPDVGRHLVTVLAANGGNGTNHGVHGRVH